MTERLHFHFSLSCIGKGNGNPLQCSCLENPRDGGAWWAAVYGVTQTQAQLKQLSSSMISQVDGAQWVIFLFQILLMGAVETGMCKKADSRGSCLGPSLELLTGVL